MASLVSLKRRIKTAKNISQLTRALEMVAASKMRKAKDKTLASRPYADKLFSITRSLGTRVDKEDMHPLFLPKESGNTLLVIFSPDRALCGPIISNLLRAFHQIKKGLEKNKLNIVTVGNKIAQKMLKNNMRIVADFPFGTTVPSFDTALHLRSLLVDGFLKGEFREVFCLYTKFESVFIQKPEKRDILPISLESASLSQKIELPYLFEPNPRTILDSILPHFIEMQLFQILMESFASEQAARMNAMHNARENAKEVVDILTLEYNKIRQEKVTNEILDIVTASIGIGNQL